MIGFENYTREAIRDIKLLLRTVLSPSEHHRLEKNTLIKTWIMNCFASPHVCEISSKSVHNLLRYTAKIHWTLHLLMHKHSGKATKILLGPCQHHQKNLNQILHRDGEQPEDQSLKV